MSVEPGFGGQKFNPVALEKIKELNRLKDKNNYNYLIEVDGGINAESAISCKMAGVDVLVCGTYLYRSKNLKEDYEKLIK
jgi:ribulose-phosphate 3-epimerase